MLRLCQQDSIRFAGSELESIGKIEQGTDGETVWEKSAIQGPRIKTGEERDVGGILIPHRIAQTGLGQEFLVQLEKVQQNPQIAPSRFDLPEDVKAMKDKGVSSK